MDGKEKLAAEPDGRTGGTPRDSMVVSIPIESGDHPLHQSLDSDGGEGGASGGVGDAPVSPSTLRKALDPPRSPSVAGRASVAAASDAALSQNGNRRASIIAIERYGGPSKVTLGELALRFCWDDDSRLVVSVLEGNVFRPSGQYAQFAANSGGVGATASNLGDTGSTDAHTLGTINGVPKDRVGGEPMHRSLRNLAQNLSQISLSIFGEDDEEEEGAVMWVELSLRKNTTSDIVMRTCQAICDKGRRVMRDGVVGVMHNPKWNEHIEYDISKAEVQQQMEARPLDRIQSTVSRDMKDRRPSAASTGRGVSFSSKGHEFLYQGGVYGQSEEAKGRAGEREAGAQSSDDTFSFNTCHLMLVLYAGNDAIGEITLPLKTLLNAKPVVRWHQLQEIDTSFLNRLRKARRKENRLSRFLEHAPEKTYYMRKLISLRVLFIAIIFFQICFTTLAIIVMLYQSAYSELTLSAEIIAKEVLNSIEEEIRTLFEAVQIQTVITAAAVESMVIARDYNTMAHLLWQNFNQTQLRQQLLSYQLYVGMADGQLVGAGNGSQVRSSNGTGGGQLTNGTEPLILYLRSQEQAANNTLTAFPLNSSCPAYDFSCQIANTTSPIYQVPGFNVKSRDWYVIGSQQSRVGWTDTYSYVDSGTLGITSTYRTPPNFSQPLLYVTSSDVTLHYLNERLGSLKYYKTGYGYLYEHKPGKPEYLIASSLNVSIQWPNGTRVAINESDSEELQVSGKFLAQLCKIQNCNFENTTVFHYNGLIISAKTFKSLDLDWDIAVVIPKTDFVTFYNHILLVSVIIALCDLLISIVVTVIVVNSIAGELARCTKQLTHFASLDFSMPIPTRGRESPVKEIVRIYEALTTMRLSLRSFSKYVPPDLVRLLVGTGREAVLGGQRRLLTIFFTDIVDFTRISESLDLDGLMEILREYLQEMSCLIQDNEGVVDKFIGDAIMALWNAPETVIDHPIKACETALLYQSRLKVLQQEWIARGFPLVAARIGVHTGEAIVGNFGSMDRLNYTALGDSVNLASRLEGLNKEYGSSIMISEDTYGFVAEFFVCRPLDVVAVKGRSHPSRVYELIAHRDTAHPEEIIGAELFTRAFQLYQEREFSKAEALFKEYLDHHNPNDIAAQMHLKSCEEFAANPPGPDWKGYRIMTTK